jgi:RNA polymerase sigma factor (TIGR02999 family)
MPGSNDDVTETTRLLCDEALTSDERAARLFPLVYKQLRAAAQVHMGSERRDHTLQATALVHEAYLKLSGDRKIPWKNRAHFYAAAAEAMRQILLDHARSKGRKKRGGQLEKLPLGVMDLAATESGDHILELDEALTRLQAENPLNAEIVRLRFYAGLSLDDTADALGIPRRTLDRRWSYLRAWMFRELQRAQGEEPDDGAGEGTKDETRG